MATRKQYQAVTDGIIKLLERGVNPWQKTWEGKNMPHNAYSGKPYRGLNPFMLHMEALEKGYQSNGWLSFKQARSLGGYVKKGEKGTTVYFWKFDRIPVTGDDIQGNEDEPTMKKVMMFRMYTVFNTEQCDGVKLPKRETDEPEPFNAIEEAEAIVAGYVNKPNGPQMLHNGGNAAFYRPSRDSISLPAREDFANSQAYYATAFHEMTHSTGHESRLDRFPKDAKIARFGSPEYSKEELVAEFGAAFLCAESGIVDTHENSAAYIQGWLKVLKNDPSMLVTAAGRAQKAADLVLKRDMVK